MLHLDTGNTGFMLLCSSLVMLMTPGLAFFYGGLVGRKNVLAIMIQSFVSMGWTTVALVRVRLLAVLLGRRRAASSATSTWRSCAASTSCRLRRNDSIPLIVLIAYQMMFAIITPALITGAFANRVTFKAYIIFLTLWLLFVYFPFVHMIWGGGLLAQWGVLDFAGGIVVHNIAGHRRARLGALRRHAGASRTPGRTASRWSRSAPVCCGSAGTASTPAASSASIATTATAFLNTDLAASFAGVAWLLVEWMTTRKPKFLGLLTGSVAGLATITPAAGYVSPQQRRADRHRRGRRLLLRRGAQEQAQVGRRARRVGRARRRRLPRHRPARRVRHQGLQPRRRRRPARGQLRRSSSSNASRSWSRPCGRSPSRSGCCGSSTA